MSFIDGFFDNVPIQVNNIKLQDLLEQKPEKGSRKLWTKPTNDVLPTEENTLLQIELGKKRDTEGNISKRLFFVTKTHLIYSKEGSTSSFRGCLELNWSRIGFEEVENEKMKSQGYFFKMTIIKNKKFTELFIPNEEKRDLLKSTIKHWCVNTGFYDDYEVIKKIGAGAFANVSFMNYFRINFRETVF
jgi:hypothetical protein